MMIMLLSYTEIWLISLKNHWIYQLSFSTCPDHDEEKEIEELRGIAIVEARFTSSDPTAYVLTQGK